MVAVTPPRVEVNGSQLDPAAVVLPLEIRHGRSTPATQPDAPSCPRNREPILAVLREHLADRRGVLEIGSGTGQHAIFVAAALPQAPVETPAPPPELPRISPEPVFELHVTREAVDLFQPDLVIAPFLKRAIPGDVWRRVPCLVVHPGIRGDRGPSALDWAIHGREREWGVTLLQANAVMDGGDTWGTETFTMREAAKNSGNWPAPTKPRTPSTGGGVRLQPLTGKSNCATARATCCAR